MLGAIIGDLAGSIYEYPEFKDTLKKQINLQRRLEIFNKKELITPDCFYSDDSILTIAITDAIVNKVSYEVKLKEYILKYGLKKLNRHHYFETMFSPGTTKWAKGEKAGNSLGTGSAMRISPIGFLFNTLDDVLLEAKKSAIPSHNSVSGIKGAKAIAVAIYMARMNYNKDDIKNYIEKNFHYNLNLNLNNLQQSNIFDYNSDNTVPIAIYIFLISNNFDDAIRKAISVGGDTDTISSIVGGMSEAYYGIDKSLIKTIQSFLPKEFNEVLDKGYSKIKKCI